jgi:hypothetical protein
MKKALTAAGSVGRIILAAGLIGAPMGAAAGVYDDCSAWWHFDFDGNANGLADVDEIRDQRDWGTAALKGSAGYHAASLTGVLGGPQWTNSTAVRPAGGQEYGGRSMRFNPAVNDSGQVWPDTFRVSGLGLAGSASLVTRFRWDGPAASGQSSFWLYNNHLEWNAYRGWLFGIMTNAAGSYLSFYTQKMTSNTDISVITGQWYDVALVLTDHGTNKVGTVEFYAWKEGGSQVYRKYNNTGVTNSINPAPLTTVGSENHVNNYATGNNIKSFKGEVNHLAVWNRALTAAEVNEAMSHPAPGFRIGLKNNKAEDLRVESEVDAEYWPGDPWHTMRRALTGGATDATLKLPLNTQQAGLDYVYHLRTQSAPSTADLRLIVNGVTNATKTAGGGQDLYWYVPRAQLQTGTNTVTLNYAAGPAAYISFDWLELDGAWQVGYDNNTPSEFVLESSAPDDFYVTDPNWQHLERAISSGETNVNIHFSLSPELIQKYFFKYTTRIISQGNGGTNHAFSVDFNTVVLKSYAPVPNGTYISFPLDRSLLRSGDNMVTFRYDDTPTIGGYLQFDFHRLEIAEAPKGTLIFMQ